MRLRTLLSLLAALAVPAAVVVSGQDKPAAPTLDSATFGDLRARPLGPAVMSGRIPALDVVTSDPRIIYVGTAGGGVWKSLNSGTTFTPVFDEHPMSIGAVRVDQSRPDTVWVGTGEAWTRNSVSVGKGIYRTTDAGKTWQPMGLADSERIAEVRVHPTRSDTVFACAVGHLWDGNDERGVFKTTDGGKTWKKVLFVDTTTGCADLEIDPQEPSVMYAAMWQVRREPHFFRSGGPGSGLYKSTDGGEKWTKVTKGLPEGDLGRIAIAVAPSRPGTLYALVESKDTSVYRSNDMGESWRAAGSGRGALGVRARPFYFANLEVDPLDHTRVYNPSFLLAVSANAGASFEMLSLSGVHPDTHALWINPKDPQHLVLGTDGGVYVSRDRGTTWLMAQNLPVSQFYHAAYDMQRPYRVYGGLQDNGSWSAPSRAMGGAGIRNRDWVNVGVGDGFHVFPDPRDVSIIFSEYQGAQVRRYHTATGEIKDIRPLAKGGEPPLRFNWNAPFIPGVDPAVLYLGGQYVFRSRDRGDSWERISPDLTTNDPAKQRQRESGGITIDNSTAENHCTIVALAESSVEPGVIWAGSDDGNVQVTRNHGKSWVDVTANVPGVPKHTWVSSIEPGRHRPGTAFATFDGHRTGDKNAYVYATDDYGKTWRAIAGPGLDGYVHVVRQDRVNPALLFAGSEFGLFVSIDAGVRWARVTGNLPAVAIYDIAIHPREHDLILATHGRGIQIIDDITPLRHLTAEIIAKPATVLPARPSVQAIAPALQDFPGHGEFIAANPPEGAVITYYLRQRHLFGKLTLEVLDAAGKVVKELPAGTRQGINRVYWTMRLDAPRSASAPAMGARAFAGPMVREGRYTVRLTRGDEKVSGTFDLIADPMTVHAAADRQQQYAAVMRLYEMQGEIAYVADPATSIRDELRARANAAEAALASDLTALAGELDRLNLSLVDRAGDLVASDPKLREKVIELYGSVLSYAGRPTASQLERVALLDSDLKKATGLFAELSGARLASLNQRLEKAGAKPVVVPPRR